MSLPEIIGHKEVQNSINQLFTVGKLPHAMLFHGAKGVGKRLVAEHTARRLLCGEKPAGMFPNEGLTFDENHELFPQIEAMSSPDFKIIEPVEGKKSISIAQIRETLRLLSLSSDGDRIVIIDAADQLNTAAANALLKTLEEPGQGIHIILISHNISKLLPTIISRCRQFRFGPLNNDDFSQVLHNIMPKKSESEISKLIEISNGSPGEAESLTGVGEDVVVMLDAFLSNLQKGSNLPAINLAEKLHKKKLAPLAMGLLLRKLATQAKSNHSFETAQLYSKLSQHKAEMELLNINPQLGLETALQDVVNTLG